MQWIENAIQQVSERQDTDSHTRMWSAKVVMALATVVKQTGIELVGDSNIIKVMLSYLYLGKDMCEYVVSEMDMSVRLVSLIMLIAFLLYMFIVCFTLIIGFAK